MSNLPNCSPPEGRGDWTPVPPETAQRLELLVRLMVCLRSLGRGSVLYLDGRAEPVLSVPVLSRRRSLAVLVVQDGGGWSYLWDAAHRTPARSARVAAELIAGVTR
ncbi:hypothetical protein [Actinomadura chokoriensis]|uniref:Uncharacterized protein n=1 Tax=Actinomadura chokoriensis TaxID=454156 RepID=A0ABV4R5W5_9ACTN